MNKKDVFLVIPGSNDWNRGDQALTWETIKLINEAGGGISQCYIMATNEMESQQTVEAGYKTCQAILKHPSRFFSNHNNVNYNIGLKVKWGCVALFDFFISFMLLFRGSRSLVKKFVSAQTLQALDLYENAEGIYVKGGGFIHNYGGIVSLYYTYFTLYHILLAIRFGKNVYIMPNSFGPFKGKLSNKLTEYILKQCKFVSSRESLSQRMLENEVHISSQLSYDLGFYLDTNYKERMETYLISRGIPLKKKKVVGLTVRPYRFPGCPNSQELYARYQQAIAEFIDYLNERDIFPLLVEHTISQNLHESDFQCIIDIMKMIKNKNYFYLSDKSLNCKEIKGIYANCDFMIGTRFHSVIFSMSELVPSIAITYGGNKGDGIMKDMNLFKYTIPIHEISSELLIEKFELMQKEESHIKDAIKKYLGNKDTMRKQLLDYIHYNKSLN